MALVRRTAISSLIDQLQRSTSLRSALGIATPEGFRASRMTLIGRIAFILSLAALNFGWVGTARAADVFTGGDAAYVDWAVKNCKAKSTDKEHRLVDQVTANNREVFLKQYTAEFQGKKLTDAAATPDKVEDLCAELKGRYGPTGSRASDLLGWSDEPTQGQSVGKASKSDGGQQRKRRQQQ
jgi:hypothetical protein